MENVLKMVRWMCDSLGKRAYVCVSVFLLTLMKSASNDLLIINNTAFIIIPRFICCDAVYKWCARSLHANKSENFSFFIIEQRKVAEIDWFHFFHVWFVIIWISVAKWVFIAFRRCTKVLIIIRDDHLDMTIWIGSARHKCSNHLQPQIIFCFYQTSVSCGQKWRTNHFIFYWILNERFIIRSASFALTANCTHSISSTAQKEGIII